MTEVASVFARIYSGYTGALRPADTLRDREPPQRMPRYPRTLAFRLSPLGEAPAHRLDVAIRAGGREDAPNPLGFHGGRRHQAEGRSDYREHHEDDRRDGQGALRSGSPRKILPRPRPAVDR